MKVYLDDTRSPPEGWVLCRSAEDCLSTLESAFYEVDEISLDHDLGADMTGYDVLLALELRAAEGLPIPGKIHIHTANTSARIKMELGVRSIEKMLLKTLNSP